MTTKPRASLLAALLALAAVAPLVASGAQPAPAATTVIAIDADPSGNDPRAVGSIEGCVSASVGQPLLIDVVLPAPGVAADRGLSGFQFTLAYDPTIVWVGEEDNSMLLAQAQGSSLVPISDQTPNKTGEYLSLVVDFGREGIEPSGASETGPGVLSRITLLPQKSGVSSLVVRDVILLDEASQDIAVEPAAAVTLSVGAPCFAPTPSPVSSTPAPAAPSAADAPTVRGFAQTGGPLPEDAATSWRLVLAGASAAATGAAALLWVVWHAVRTAHLSATADDARNSSARD